MLRKYSIHQTQFADSGKGELGFCAGENRIIRSIGLRYDSAFGGVDGVVRHVGESGCMSRFREGSEQCTAKTCQVGWTVLLAILLGAVACDVDLLLDVPAAAHVACEPGSVSGACCAASDSPWPSAFPPPPPRLGPHRNRTKARPPQLHALVRRLRWYYALVRLLVSVHLQISPSGFPLRPAALRQRADTRSPGSRARSFCACSRSPTARSPEQASPKPPAGCGLPHSCTASALPSLSVFAAQYSACTYPCPTLRVRPRGRMRMARGQRDGLGLRCTTLAFATPRRFIPALATTLTQGVPFSVFNLCASSSLSADAYD